MGLLEQQEGAVQLGTLAERINAEHRACATAEAALLMHAIRCGELLIEAKAECKAAHGHGSWLPWLAKHFEGSESTAQVYMKLARNKDVLVIEANPQRAAFSCIRTALVAIAPSHPMPTVPHTTGGVSDAERQRRADERKLRKLTELAAYAIRTGDLDPPLDLSVAPIEWDYALRRVVSLRDQNMPKIIDILAHQLGYVVKQADPEAVGRDLAKYSGDYDVAEQRAAMLAELGDGVAWLQRVLEEADRQQRQIERYEEADKVGEQLRMQNPE